MANDDQFQQLLAAMQGGGGNPYVAGGSTFLGLLGQLFGGGESDLEQAQREAIEGRTARVNALFGDIRGGKYGQYGQDVIDPAQQQNLMSLFTQSMQPQLQRIRGQAIRQTGLRSPFTFSNIGRQTMPLFANFAGNLQRQNLNLTQNRNMGLLNALSSMARG